MSDRVSDAPLPAESPLSSEAALTRHEFNIREAVQRILIGRADELSCTTTPTGVGLQIATLRLVGKERDIVKAELIRQVEEYGIRVVPVAKKRKGAPNVSYTETDPVFEPEPQLESVFLPHVHIPDLYAPSSALLLEATRILQDVLPRVCSGLTVTVAESTHSVSFNAMSSLIGVEVSAALKQISLDDIRRASFHRILVHAGIELCVGWCESIGVSALNEQKAKVLFDMAGVHTVLCQLRQRRFQVPLAPEQISFGQYQQQEAAA